MFKAQHTVSLALWDSLPTGTCLSVGSADSLHLSSLSAARHSFQALQSDCYIFDRHVHPEITMRTTPVEKTIPRTIRAEHPQQPLEIGQGSTQLAIQLQLQVAVIGREGKVELRPRSQPS